MIIPNVHVTVASLINKETRRLSTKYEKKVTITMADASVENRLQVSLENDVKDANFTKRMKKEPGAVTGKSVVVLRGSDVTRSRNESVVFMPNTIEMAQLKKPDKGQFKTNVQISSKMTDKDIQKSLEETFPILRRQRFYCAAAVDNRSRLDFHGEPRIWDGHSIKRKIKGNSALYILIEETQQQHGDHDSKESEPLTLKRSHDQMTTSEQTKQSVTSDITPEETPSRPITFHHVTYPGFEKQAEPGNPPKHIRSFPVVVSGPTPTVVENDNLPPSEKQLRQQEGLNKFPAMQHLVLVPSPHMPPPVCCSSVSRDVVNMATSLAPSFSMGTFMVPAGGIVVAQPRQIVNQAITTVSDHQSLGKAAFHVVKGPDARQTGMQITPQGMLSTTLTPEMNKLNISNATSQQSQKSVITEKSVAKKDQNIQTDGTEPLHQDRPMTTLAQSSGPIEYPYKTVSVSQDVFSFKSPADQLRQSYNEKTSLSQIIEKGACGTTASMGAAAAVDRHQHRPAVLSDYEQTLSSDQTDSGIETTDNTREAISQAGESYLDVAKKTQGHMQKPVKSKEAEWSRTEIGGGGLSLLTAAMEIREQKSIVEEICPKSSSLRGGSDFILILNDPLPSDLEVGFAYFGNSRPIALKKVNEVNLAGIIPAYHSPGIVKVKLMSSTNSYLGETAFHYIDDVEAVLRQLVHNPELQRRFFNFWAQGLDTTESESIEDSSQPPSKLKTRSARLHQLVQRLFELHPEVARKFFHCWVQRLGNETSEKNEVYDNEYDADDEASSSDSSEDGNVFCNKDGNLHSISLPSNVGMKYDEWELPRSIQAEKQSNSQLEYERFFNRGNVYDQEQANGLMAFFVFRERFYNSPNTSINENLDNLAFHGPESEARIIELDTSACPIKQEEEPNGSVCDNRAGVRENSEARSNNTINTDIIDKERNYVDFDQNSVADKTRRAEERSSEETDDSPGDPL